MICIDSRYDFKNPWIGKILLKSIPSRHLELCTFFSQIHKFLLFPIDKRISVTGTSKRHFQQYFSYNIAVIGFIRGGKPIDKNFK